MVPYSSGLPCHSDSNRSPPCQSMNPTASCLLCWLCFCTFFEVFIQSFCLSTFCLVLECKWNYGNVRSHITAHTNMHVVTLAFTMHAQPSPSTIESMCKLVVPFGKKSSENCMLVSFLHERGISWPVKAHACPSIAFLSFSLPSMCSYIQASARSSQNSVGTVRKTESE